MATKFVVFVLASFDLDEDSMLFIDEVDSSTGLINDKATPLSDEEDSCC